MKGGEVGLAALCLAAGCTGAAPIPGSDAAPVMSRIDSTQVLLRTGQGLGDPMRAVLRDSEAWEQFWSQAHSLLEPAPAPPSVNFADSMLLVAALGTRSTGGFSVAIDSVSRGSALRVFVTSIAPGPRCVSTMAISWPVQVVRVARFDGSVEFVEKERTEQCE
jgi:hypothetical protein